MTSWWLLEYPEPLDVTLHRDSYTTPWGFRIAGGLDYGQTPIVVTQVNLCSPADGQLAVGDVIISVDHQQVVRRRHFDVLSMLSQEAGGTLELQVYRGATADEIKARSGFNVRFHAPLTYFPVNSSTSWHAPSNESATLERPNSMYRTVNSGTTGRPVHISVRRQNPYQVTSTTTPSPGGRTATQIYFNPQQDEYMLHKVQQSLDALTLGRSSRLDDSADRNDPDYNFVPVSDKRRLFNQPEQTSSPGSYLQQYQQRRPRPSGGYFDNYYPPANVATRPTRAHSVGAGQRGPVRGMTPSSYSAFIRPRSSMGQPTSTGHPKPPEFCWMPRGLRTRRGVSQPTRTPSSQQPQSYYTTAPPAYQPYDSNYHSAQPATQTPETVHVFSPAGGAEGEANYVPPWRGTLHSASPSAWIEGALIDPMNPIYHHDHKHRAPDAPAEPIQVIETKESEDGRKVVHLQYNSPLQLYSSDEAKKALEEQTVSQGGPEGTIMIKGGRPGAPPQKITDSTVYRMVLEEDLRKQKRLQRSANPPPRQSSSSSSRQRQPAASASGQLKVVLTQPPQDNNYFQGSSNDAAPSGFSDF